MAYDPGTCQNCGDVYSDAWASHVAAPAPREKLEIEDLYDAGYDGYLGNPDAPTRDDRTAGYAVGREARRNYQAPGLYKDRTIGGGIRRLLEFERAPAREDGLGSAEVPGRTVPLDYARYYAPTVDPGSYELHRLGAWQVILPRSFSARQVEALLALAYQGGPEAAGLVRYGDYLVPKILGPGDRMILGGATYAPAHPLSI